VRAIWPSETRSEFCEDRELSKLASDVLVVGGGEFAGESKERDKKRSFA
jgi:hypothetical protein